MASPGKAPPDVHDVGAPSRTLQRAMNAAGDRHARLRHAADDRITALIETRDDDGGHVLTCIGCGEEVVPTFIEELNAELYDGVSQPVSTFLLEWLALANDFALWHASAGHDISVVCKDCEGLNVWIPDSAGYVDEWTRAVEGTSDAAHAGDVPITEVAR